MRTRTPAETLASDGRSRGRTAVRGEDAADRWGRVSVPQREDLTSGTRSSVTSRRGSSARAASARAELEWAGLRAEFRPLAAVFSFSFYAVFVLYLNLCNKSCVDPKIMEIFV